ncbi:hypothetical protein R3P38DRAFT_3230030 [Favolaschia claudopus]|uniref:Uncharacterized protein n=1 Tax=Favolaschia claudopus TaxID=2862362 RepID=A0AAV9ZNR9_9AGAR
MVVVIFIVNLGVLIFGILNTDTDSQAAQPANRSDDGGNIYHLNGRAKTGKR